MTPLKKLNISCKGAKTLREMQINLYILYRSYAVYHFLTGLTGFSGLGKAL
jgi:hypothetical protein